ncbi:hypothetical protein, partial [Leptospira ilyithenensis]|uniref:hypothetical protein n=1 Tax=Leptospira ilyithenensis TaxID=2484901 RepID=UPI001AEF4041
IIFPFTGCVTTASSKLSGEYYINTALMLVTARLRHLASPQWGSKKYLDITKIEKLKFESQ